MPLPLLSGGVRVTVEGLWDGQVTNNILYFQKAAGDPLLPEMVGLASTLDQWYSTTMLPALNENFTYNRIICQAINVGSGFRVENADNAGPGAVTGESAPNNVDPCLSFRSSLGGRSNRGRNYIPGISNSDVIGNIVDADWRIAVQTAYAELLPGGTYDPDPFVWVIASFFTAGAPRGSAVATPVVSCFFTDSIVDSQRRRLPGRGR